MYSNKTYICFNKYEHQMTVPFIIYVHFDSLQVPEKKKIVHRPCGFGYSVKCSYDDTSSKYEEYLGEDSAKVLWEKLEDEVRDITRKLQSRAEPQVLNDEEKSQLKKASRCYFCNKELYERRVEDFHPLTGRFLGAAHLTCRRKTKVPNFVPVVMNDFKKYGSHFLLKDLKKEELERNFFFVGDNQGFCRKYRNGVSLRFFDLRQFIDDKIEDLEKILSDSKKRRIKEFKKKVVFDLVKKKNYFPYYYVNSFDKLLDKKLPSKEGFFDQLNDDDIADEDYQRSVDIWTTFGCTTIDDYFKVYVKSNVLLLEDIFENFRLLCLDKYHLDPAHYYTIASFSWDSMLKYTGVKLEVLKDKYMVSFIKANIRGGLAQCSKRHAKANNIYCNYDKSKPSTFIIYLDANNLGGWAMSQNLPFSDFRWLNRAEIENLKDKIQSLDESDEFGYFFEVDLEYPKSLHELHNDLPFCSEKRAVASSPYSKCDNKRSVLAFYDKKKYGMDYRTLKQCLENGLVLKNVSRALKFKQCKWLEPYIAYNTTLRAKARNEFEIKLYKLLNNSVSGKTMQRSSDDKPTYAGFSILEQSKKFMYDFHYKHMIPKYKDKLNLLYIDTDGVIYEIETSDFFQDLKLDKNLLKMMDTSNLDKRWNIPVKNKKVVGKMKEEYGGKIIQEFLGVRARIYYLNVEGEEVKKAVGMKRYVKAKYISRDDYAKCVLKDETIRRSHFETLGDNHEVVSVRKMKTVLSPGDTKRIVLDDKVRTLALGYRE